MKKHALVIGINQYEDAAHINPLRYAEQDASAIRYFLQRRCGFEVAPLIGSEATRRRISDAVYDLCRDLGPDDLFVFYFAGHGHEDARGHLLLAADVRLRELQAGMAPDVVPVRGLEKMTGSGFSRLLVLDACRSPLEKGRSGAAVLNRASTRDLQEVAKAGSGNPPLAVLCSCSPEQRAHELDELNSGVFTEALIAVLEERLARNAGFYLPGDLDVLSQGTGDLLRRYEINDSQDPWCTANRGALELISQKTTDAESSSTSFSPAPPPPTSVPRRKVCPLCGMRNDPDETFKCLSCSKDFLCTDHFVKAERCCEECAARRKSEREAEQRKKRRTEEEERLRREGPDELELDCGNGVKLKMKKIPAGSFMMGSENGYDDEQPVHKVTFQRPFYMGIYPVTQAQYEAVTGENPSHFSDEPDSPQRPVEHVSWEDAKKFCQKLAHKTGKPVRLPSEAEWEYACRAGSTTKYCFGDDESELELYANYNGTPIYGDKSTSPVGAFRPNDWGLYDMHGNVWEWCEDKYHDNYNGAPTDGSPWLSGGGSGRVGRGGGWGNNAGYCRSASRNGGEPGNRYYILGFRLALSPAVH